MRTIHWILGAVALIAVVLAAALFFLSKPVVPEEDVVEEQSAAQETKIVRSVPVVPAPVEAIFNPETIKVGDTVGIFTLTEAGVYHPGSDSVPNTEYFFKGNLTTTAVYNWSDFGMYYLDQLPEATKSIPHVIGGRMSFCADASEQMFAAAGIEAGDKVRITFDEVRIVQFQADVCSPSLNITKVEKL